MATMRSIGVRLRLYADQYAKDAQEAAKRTKDIGEQAKRSRESLEAMSGKMMLAGGAMVAAFALVVRAGMTFDKQMSEVAAVSGAASDELGKLRQAAIDAGAATQYSATEAALAEAELAKAGLSTADILGGALDGALSLAAAGTLELENAASIAAKAMNIFGLKGSDVAHIADVLAAAANKSATDVKELGDAMMMGGLAAKNAGMSLEDTVGTLAAFADNALAGSDGGTSFKTMLQMLAAPSAEATRKMHDLNIQAYDAQGNFVGIARFAGNLQTALKNLTQEQRNEALATIFGADAMRAATILYNEGEGGIRDYIAAVDDQGAAATVASTKMDNLSGDVEQLTGSIESLTISSSSGANKGLREMTKAANVLVDGVAALPGPLQQGAVWLVGLSGAALLATGAAIKARAGFAAMNEQLIATGAAGALAAKGLRVFATVAGTASVALLGLGIAMEAVDKARHKFDNWKLLDPRSLNLMANGLGVAGDSLVDTAHKVDAALTEMAKNGHAADALLLVSQAAQASGRSIDEVKSQLPGYTKAVEGMAEMTRQQAVDAIEARDANIKLGGAFGEAASKAGGLQEAFDALNGAELDWRDKARQAEAAVDKLNDALDKSNGSLDITTEKGRDAQEAVDALAKAAIAASQAKWDETHSVEEANKVYQEYIKQLQDLLIKAGMSEQAVADLINQIAQVPEYKQVTLVVKTTTFGAEKQILDAEHATRRRRFGGVTTHAATGLLRDAMVATTPQYSWAEPATGGEAFVPKNGNYGRSMSILSQAAGWYGADVVPRGSAWGGGAASAPAEPIQLVLSWAGGSEGRITSAVGDSLRVDVVRSGRSDVQAHYGRRGKL